MHIVINSYGATLSKDLDLFCIETPEGKQMLPPDKVKSISIHKASRITSDAVILAIKHNIEILFVSETGMPEGRVWSIKYGSVSAIRKAQIEFLYSNKSINWIKNLLHRKIEAQIALLLALQPASAENLVAHNQVKFTINSMEDYKSKIAKVEGTVISEIAPSLRGWEGAAGKKYFHVISSLLPSEYRFEGRSRMPATDPFNSLLNYAYGILYGKVEGALIKAGLDPYVGVFHRDEYKRPALVFDFIEPYRVWMDYVLVQLCCSRSFPNDSFTLSETNGGIILSAIAKRILIQSVNDYLSEIIEEGEKARSRQVLMEYDAQKLAKVFLNA